VGECRVDPFGSGLGPVEGFCEYGDELTCSEPQELAITLSWDIQKPPLTGC
jgi:hypothetical protein